MEKLLAEQNLLQGIRFVITVNIFLFFTAVIISVGWT